MAKPTQILILLAALSGSAPARADLDVSLREAARDDDRADIAKFVQQGAQLDGQSAEGLTALMYATQRCHVENARKLLEAGAQPRKKDQLGRSALVYAIRSSCLPAVKLLLRHAVPADLTSADKTGKSAWDYARKASAIEIEGDGVEIFELVRTKLIKDGSAMVRKDAESVRWDSGTRKWTVVPKPSPGP